MSEDREYPARPFIGVGAVVVKDGQVLMIRRGQPPREGQWSIPGGLQEVGETAADAALREVLEETGVTARITGFLGHVDAITPDDDGRVRHHYTLLDFSARWIAGDPRPASDALDARWMGLHEIESLALWPETLAMIRKALAAE